MMAEIKTRPTGVAVDEFIDKVPNPQRREDAKKVRALMERLWASRPDVGPHHRLRHLPYKYEAC